MDRYKVVDVLTMLPRFKLVRPSCGQLQQVVASIVQDVGEGKKLGIERIGYIIIAIYSLSTDESVQGVMLKIDRLFTEYFPRVEHPEQFIKYPSMTVALLIALDYPPKKPHLEATSLSEALDVLIDAMPSDIQKSFREYGAIDIERLRLDEFAESVRRVEEMRRKHTQAGAKLAVPPEYQGFIDRVLSKSTSNQ